MSKKHLVEKTMIFRSLNICRMPRIERSMYRILAVNVSLQRNELKLYSSSQEWFLRGGFSAEAKQQSHFSQCEPSKSQLMRSRRKLHIISVFPAVTMWPYPTLNDENNAVSTSSWGFKVSVVVSRHMAKTLDIKKEMFMPVIRVCYLPPNCNFPRFPSRHITVDGQVSNIWCTPITDKSMVVIQIRHFCSAL